MSWSGQGLGGLVPVFGRADETAGLLDEEDARYRRDVVASGSVAAVAA